MKRKKYDEGTEGLSNNPRFQSMMSGDTRRTSTGLTPSASNYPSTSSVTPSAKKAVVRQKPAMNAEMQRVARLQQKMKDAGYNIKVDGIWKKGGETEKAYQGYIKDKTADASRRGTVNTGQGPTINTPAKNSTSTGYNPLDSPILRQASADTQARMNREQAAAEAKRKAREAEITRNSQSLPSDTRANRFTFNAGNKGQGTDVTAIQNEAQLRNRLVGDGATSKNSTRVNYAEGTKKVSGYSKLDMKLGGLLPGGVSRAEYKAAKAAKNAPSTVGPLAGGYGVAPKPTEGVGPLAGGYVKPAPDLSKPAGPMTDIRRYTNADNMPAGTSTASAKKSLKAQYEENKGGYARALKGGKKDASGNVIDEKTGLAYKVLPTKTGGAGGGTGKGGSKATVPSKENSLYKNGVAVKNFKDTRTGVSYFTNGRAFDEKTGRMAKYTHDPKTKKVSLQWDKAKVAPKRKGDDTYMDEVIDIGSRTIGSLGGAALLGGSTFGVGSVAGGIAGDRAGKAFGNWLNKKLGYREENDTSQEGYSLGEAAFGALGGAGGRLVKPVGSALIKFAGKEGAKMAASPLGRAVAATGKAAGKLTGRGGSKTAAATQQTAQAAGQTTSKAATQAAAKTVNVPGAVSKVVPTRQSSLAVGNTGKIPTKAVRGERGRFTRNPSRQPVNTTPSGSKIAPERPARFNPDNAIIRPNGPTAMDKIGRTPGTTSSASSQAASNTAASTTGKAAQNTAKTSVSKTRAAARLARQKGKKLITYANNNKKKVALGALGGAGLIGGGYGLSQMRTGE